MYKNALKCTKNEQLMQCFMVELNAQTPMRKSGHRPILVFQ